MLSYSDFYDIAKHGNENWRAKLTEKEIAVNAFMYYSEYLISLEQKKLTKSLYVLRRLLEEDAKQSDDETLKDWIRALTIE